MLRGWYSVCRGVEPLHPDPAGDAPPRPRGDCSVLGLVGLARPPRGLAGVKKLQNICICEFFVVSLQRI